MVIKIIIITNSWLSQSEKNLNGNFSRWRQW